MRPLRVLLLATACAVVAAPPAAAQLKLYTDFIRQHDARPGETVEGTITVQNQTAEPQEIRITLADYTFSYDTTAIGLAPGSLPRSNAGWISVTPDFLAVAPHGTAQLSYTLTVPPSTPAGPPEGTYWSTIIVEPVPRGSAESSAEQVDIHLVRVVQYVIQVVSHIRDTGHRELAFTEVALRDDDREGRVLQVDLQNTGTLGFRPAVWVELYDAGGELQAKLDGQSFIMYPETAVRHAIPVGGLPAGEYTALVVADGGEGALYGMQLVVTL
jgi:hypothetical protein